MVHFKFDFSFRSALPVFAQDPVNVIVLLSTTTLLPCLVQEHNSFTYTWSFEGQAVPLPLPGYDLLSNGSLLIQSVDTSHGGSYVCSVNNSIMIVTGNVFLEVQGNFSHICLCEWTQTHTHHNKAVCHLPFARKY